MDHSPGVQEGQSIQQLPSHFEHFLLLEDGELLLECEERVLCVLHDEVEVRFAGIAVVEFDDVFVVDHRQDLHLPHQVLPHLPRMRQRHCLLRQQHPALLLLHQVDEGVRAHPNRLDPIEEKRLRVWGLLRGRLLPL
jgi:hypothetical protein